MVTLCVFTFSQVHQVNIHSSLKYVLTFINSWREYLALFLLKASLCSLANFVFLVIWYCAGSITLFHQSFFAQKNYMLKPNRALIRVTQRVKLLTKKQCKQSTRLTPHSHSFAMKCISLQMNGNINISMEEKLIFCFHEAETNNEWRQYVRKWPVRWVASFVRDLIKDIRTTC